MILLVIPLKASIYLFDKVYFDLTKKSQNSSLLFFLSTYNFINSSTVHTEILSSQTKHGVLSSYAGKFYRQTKVKFCFNFYLLPLHHLSISNAVVFKFVKLFLGGRHTKWAFRGE